MYISILPTLNEQDTIRSFIARIQHVLHAEKADADALIQEHIINKPPIRFYKNQEDWKQQKAYYP